MLFNSFQFLVFFIVVSITYFLIPHRLRWILLLASSYIFYMAWSPVLIILLVFSTFINYVAAIRIYGAERKNNQSLKKRYLMICLFINFGLLFIFKYLMFINETIMGIFLSMGIGYPIPEFNIVLPMGISFYTFQASAYTIDVYRGKIKPLKHYGKFSLFISFFPQLVAGPIERSQNLIPQFFKRHYPDFERTIMGLKIMLWGYFKKVVIADRAAIAVNTIFNSCESYSGLYYVIALILFTFQIYCDFSGYSDIAVGSAKIMGFNLMRNFDRPFFSTRIKEFWRNWHISLSTWFTDYVYIPLGGNRVSKIKHYRNLIVTFLLSGLWHGSAWTFVIWGGLHGLYLVVGEITLPFRTRVKEFLHIQNSVVMKFFEIIITFALVAYAFIFFRANSFQDAIYIINHILWDFRMWLEPQYLYEVFTNMGLNIYELIVVSSAIIIMLFAEAVFGRDMHINILKKPAVVEVLFYSLIAVFVLTAGVYYNAGEFIYFQF
ncbi:MAG TPA: MBOAT family protein [Candidatus Fimicola cottocaccae]|nr:MBOAT family protein [Candidatus Fimicola cottocaccae]